MRKRNWTFTTPICSPSARQVVRGLKTNLILLKRVKMTILTSMTPLGSFLAHQVAHFRRNSWMTGSSKFRLSKKVKVVCWTSTRPLRGPSARQVVRGLKSNLMLLKRIKMVLWTSMTPLGSSLAHQVGHCRRTSWKTGSKRSRRSREAKIHLWTSMTLLGSFSGHLVGLSMTKSWTSGSRRSNRRVSRCCRQSLVCHTRASAGLNQPQTPLFY